MFSVTRTRTMLFLLSAALLGCGSFNSYQYPVLKEPFNPPSPFETTRAEQDKIKFDTTTCPLFALPKLGKRPEIPLRAIERAGPSGKEMDDIQQKYIEELRAYIKNTQESYAAAYNAYLRKCAPDKVTASE